MLFTVEQRGTFCWRLLLEYGRVLGKSRRKTLPGKLILLPGAWILLMGSCFLLGMVIALWEGSITEDEALGMIVMVPLTLLLVLWGLSWTGVNRLPAALVRLLALARRDGQTRFYPNHIEDTGGGVNMDCSYQAVLEVYEGRLAFYLRLNPGQFLVLQKDCFLSGRPDAFRRFMDERCGRAVIMLSI